MNRLKTRRKELLLTQKQVAKKVGIAESAYQRYENGENVPNACLAISIAKALETTVEDLYGD